MVWEAPLYTASKKATDGKFVPPVIIGVPNDKTRQQEKEVYRKITVVHQLGKMTGCKRLAKMEGDNDDGSYPAQAI